MVIVSIQQIHNINEINPDTALLLISIPQKKEDEGVSSKIRYTCSKSQISNTNKDITISV